MAIPIGLRDQKKQDTRTRLSDAAVDLIRNHGYVDVTVADIADAAGVSRRTFSNYFASKAECVISVGEAETAGIIPRILANEAGQPLIQRISAAFRALPEQVYDNCLYLHRLRQEQPEVMAAMARADEQLTADLTDKLVALSDGTIDRLRITVIVAAVCAATYTCMVYWLEQGSPGGTGTLAGLIEQTLSIVDLTSLEDVSASLISPTD